MFELYIKYLLEGIAVAVAAYFIPRKKVQVTEIIFIALSAAATFALLDVFAPKVGDSARKGAGFGIGANTVGWPGVGLERFEDSESSKKDKDEKSTETFTSDTSKSASTKSSDTASTKSTDTVSTKSSDTASTKSTDSNSTKESSEVQPFEMNKKYSTF